MHWTTVVLIRVVGTLVTDTVTDRLGVSLRVTTPVLASRLPQPLGAPEPQPVLSA